MAHTTAAKVTASQKGNVIGKRRGIKAFGGTTVKPGAILVRQLGKKVIPGKNTGLGKDYTIYSKVEGVVTFTNGTGFKRGKKVVHVLPVQSVIESKKSK